MIEPGILIETVGGGCGGAAELPCLVKSSEKEVPEAIEARRPRGRAEGTEGAAEAEEVEFEGSSDMTRRNKKSSAKVKITIG